MSIFKLPDLGEGLQEAEIREWHVSVGDEVKVDQLLVSVETDKAVVDIPSPQSGRIQKLNGEPGDILQVGAALVEFEGGEAEPTDKGTVVGRVEVGQEVDVTATIALMLPTGDISLGHVDLLRIINQSE